MTEKKKAYMREYRAKNLERIRANNRNYYWQYREQMLAYSKNYYRKRRGSMTDEELEEHREYYRVMSKVYRQVKKEKKDEMQTV